MESSLLSVYDSLKGDATPAAPPIRLKMGPMDIHKYRHQAGMNHGLLREKCGKHILLDIYCKILPLDQDYIDTHQGQMGSDISCMLKQKGMTPTEYLTSAYEKTKAPLLEYVLNCINMIGESYFKEAEDQLEDAMNGEGPDTPPPVPSTEEEPVKSQLVDLKNDMEYQQFVDILKKKTVDKIVDDVSELINSKKEENEMEFNTSGGGEDDFGSLGGAEPAPEAPAEENPGEESPQPSEEIAAGESAVAVGLEYMANKLWKYKFTEAGKDAAMALAIREASMYQMDKVFRQKSFQEYVSGIRFGQGYVVNDSAVQAFTESISDASSVAQLVVLGHQLGKIHDDLKKQNETLSRIASAISNSK